MSTPKSIMFKGAKYVLADDEGPIRGEGTHVRNQIGNRLSAIRNELRMLDTYFEHLKEDIRNDSLEELGRVNAALDEFLKNTKFMNMRNQMMNLILGYPWEAGQ